MTEGYNASYFTFKSEQHTLKSQAKRVSKAFVGRLDQHVRSHLQVLRPTQQDSVHFTLRGGDCVWDWSFGPSDAGPEGLPHGKLSAFSRDFDHSQEESAGLKVWMLKNCTVTEIDFSRDFELSQEESAGLKVWMLKNCTVTEIDSSRDFELSQEESAGLKVWMLKNCTVTEIDSSRDFDLSQEESAGLKVWMLKNCTVTEIDSSRDFDHSQEEPANLRILHNQKLPCLGFDVLEAS